MNFAELITKCIENTNGEGFYFQMVLLEVNKACGKKPATLKLQITDEIADHLFKYLDHEARFGLCIPEDIFNEVRENAKKSKKKICHSYASLNPKYKECEYREEQFCLNDNYCEWAETENYHPLEQDETKEEKEEI